MVKLQKYALLQSTSKTFQARSPRSILWRNIHRAYSAESSSSSFQTDNVSKQSPKRNYGYPDLMRPDPLLDLHQALVIKPTSKSPYTNRIIVRNDPPLLDGLRDWEVDELGEETIAERAGVNTWEDVDDQKAAQNRLPISTEESKRLYKYPLVVRRITQQTGKGKIHRMYSLVVVGNGDGLVGYGEGKDNEVPEAMEKAFSQAIRNMDTVERFESRTLWTETSIKFGATRIILRPRPVGFGLHCNPNVHQVLKAAGIKDASAKVWGSRNKISVIKALFTMLQGGNAHLAMGDGIGGGGRRLDRGSGLRSKDSVERDRGRKLYDLRTR